jgi:tetratricopeptide (TPR) repeat protein
MKFQRPIEYIVLAGVCLSALGCSAKMAREPQYVPAANLVEIVNDFQRMAREDLYRFSIPKDVTGINIMKATLIRLQDYEKNQPGRFSDIIEFNKALAYERLREYERAIAHYRTVAESNGRLATEATRSITALESFQAILGEPLPPGDPFKYTEALDQKVAAWNGLIRRYLGTPYEYLARVEEERVDRAKVAFVELNRHRMKDGNQLVILGYSQLVTKHRYSKNLYRHLLDFGDFYFDLAKEYAAQNDPEGLSFAPEDFDYLAKSALKLYTEVAATDGIMEKVEAQGKIEGLRGFVERTRRLGR